jgi:hypothetical protein
MVCEDGVGRAVEYNSHQLRLVQNGQKVGLCFVNGNPACYYFSSIICVKKKLRVGGYIYISGVVWLPLSGISCFH